VPTFSIAATWSANVSPDAAARAVSSLDGMFPRDALEQFDVALSATEAVIHLKLTVTPYPNATIQKVDKEITKSGGRFIELWRLPKPERESFRMKYLTQARKGGDFDAAGELIRDFVTKLAASPAARPQAAASPGPSASPASPARAAAAPLPPSEPPLEDAFATDDADALAQAFQFPAGPAASEPALEDAFKLDGASEPDPRPEPEPDLEDAFAGADEGIALDVDAPADDGVRKLAGLGSDVPAPEVPELSDMTVLPAGGTRRSPRFAVSLDVEFQTEVDFVREHATNISNGGMFIQTAERPAVGTAIEVKVKLPNGEELRSPARVAHHVTLPGEVGGVGIAFTPEDADFQEALDRYLASLAGPS
jgi:uncharacterized protein (TIGR02266 family)